MTAEFYKKNETVQRHLDSGTVSIDGNPYVNLESRVVAAIDTWTPPDPQAYEERHYVSRIWIEGKFCFAEARMDFRLRGSQLESDWSTYFQNYACDAMEATTKDGKTTYIPKDFTEKACSGALARVFDMAGIGTVAKKSVAGSSNQQRPQAAQQQPTQQPLPTAPKKPIDPWTPPFAKLDDKAKLHVRKTILSQVEASEEDLDSLIDQMLKANPNTTGNEILAEATSG